MENDSPLFTGSIQRVEDGWKLRFEGGEFSQNWLKRLEIDEMIVRIDPDVEVGQTVLYGKYSGTEVTVEGEDYLILRESDILAVLG